MNTAIISTHDEREQIIGSHLSKYLHVNPNGTDPVIKDARHACGTVWEVAFDVEPGDAFYLR